MPIKFTASLISGPVGARIAGVQNFKPAIVETGAAAFYRGKLVRITGIEKTPWGKNAKIIPLSGGLKSKPVLVDVEKLTPTYPPGLKPKKTKAATILDPLEKELFSIAPPYSIGVAGDTKCNMWGDDLIRILNHLKGEERQQSYRISIEIIGILRDLFGYNDFRFAVQTSNLINEISKNNILESLKNLLPAYKTLNVLNNINIGKELYAEDDPELDDSELDENVHGIFSAVRKIGFGSECNSFIMSIYDERYTIDSEIILKGINHIFDVISEFESLDSRKLLLDYINLKAERKLPSPLAPLFQFYDFLDTLTEEISGLNRVWKPQLTGFISQMRNANPEKFRDLEFCENILKMSACKSGSEVEAAIYLLQNDFPPERELIDNLCNSCDQKEAVLAQWGKKIEDFKLFGFPSLIGPSSRAEIVLYCSKYLASIIDLAKAADEDMNEDAPQLITWVDFQSQIYAALDKIKSNPELIYLSLIKLEKINSGQKDDLANKIRDFLTRFPFYSEEAGKELLANEDFFNCLWSTSGYPELPPLRGKKAEFVTKQVDENIVKKRIESSMSVYKNMLGLDFLKKLTDTIERNKFSEMLFAYLVIKNPAILKGHLDDEFIGQMKADFKDLKEIKGAYLKTTIGRLKKKIDGEKFEEILKRKIRAYRNKSQVLEGIISIANMRLIEVRRQKTLKDFYFDLMGNVMLSYGLTDPQIYQKLNSDSLYLKMKALEQSCSHRIDLLLSNTNLSLPNEVQKSFNDSKNVFLNEFSKIEVCEGAEALYEFIPCKFLAIWRGYLANDCTKGFGNNALHPNIMYYLIIEKGKIAGYIGLMETQKDQQKYLGIDTIQVEDIPSKAIPKIAAGLQQVATGNRNQGIMLPTEENIRKSFNYEVPRKAVLQMASYRNGKEIEDFDLVFGSRFELSYPENLSEPMILLDEDLELN